MTTVQVQEKKGCSGIVVWASEKWWKLLEDAKTVVCPLHWGFGWQNEHLKWFLSLLSAYSMPNILLCAIYFSLLVCHISCVKMSSNPRWGLGLGCRPLALVESCCHLLTLWKSRRLVIWKYQKKDLFRIRISPWPWCSLITWYMLLLAVFHNILWPLSLWVEEWTRTVLWKR